MEIKRLWLRNGIKHQHFKSTEFRFDCDRLWQRNVGVFAVNVLGSLFTNGIYTAGADFSSHQLGNYWSHRVQSEHLIYYCIKKSCIQFGMNLIIKIWCCFFFQMSSVKAKSPSVTRSSSPVSSASVTPPPEISKEKNETMPNKSARLSRSSTRRFLYFHNKTLSKIKLL